MQARETLRRNYYKINSKWNSVMEKFDEAFNELWSLLEMVGMLDEGTKENEIAKKHIPDIIDFKQHIVNAFEYARIPPEAFIDLREWWGSE